MRKCFYRSGENATQNDFVPVEEMRCQKDVISYSGKVAA